MSATSPTRRDFLATAAAVSRKYCSTGGWGFAQFDDDKPASEAEHNTCFSCHATVKARDFVFNRYAP